MNWTLDPDAVYVDGDPPDKADIRQSMRDLSRRFSGKGVVSLGEFGAIGDGSVLNSAVNIAAFAAARAAALAHGVGSIGIPPGVFVIANPLITVTAGAPSLLEPGLRIVGAGPYTPTINSDFSRIIYTGTAAMLDIRQADAAAANGGYTFENMELTCNNAAASCMRFNWYDVDGVEYTPTDDGTTPGWLANIVFRNCGITGAAGSGSGNDGIMLKKIGGVLIDENCHFEGWRRAVRACVENGEFLFHASGNGRHLQLEGISTFGNNNKVDLRFMGATIDAGEDEYCVYDTSKGMVFGSGLLEPTTGTTACIFIGGTGSRFLAPYFGPLAAIPLWEMGVNCGDVTMLDPSCPPGTFGAAPVYAEPTSYETGNSNAFSYRMRIVGGNHSFRAKVGMHPRLIWGGDPDRCLHLGNTPDPQRPRIDSTGGRPVTVETISPLHFPCSWTGSDVGGPSSRQTDATAPFGHVFRLLGTGNPGFIRELRVGNEVKNNDWLRIVVLAKMEATGGAGNWHVAMYKNYAAIGGATANLTDSITFAQTVYTFQITGCVDGDAIGIAIKRSSDTHYLDWAMMTWAVVEANIANLALTTLTDTPASADALRDNITAQWETQIEDKLTAILDAMGRANLIAR